MSMTTSIRLKAELRRDLDRMARREGRGLNWVIVRAAEEFLKRHGMSDLQEEARRQSLKAAQSEAGADADTRWDEVADLQGWK